MTEEICVHYDRCGGCSNQETPYQKIFLTKKRLILMILKVF